MISAVPNFVYVILCLVIPPIWGVLAARIFDTLARRRQQQQAEPGNEDEWTYQI